MEKKPLSHQYLSMHGMDEIFGFKKIKKLLKKFKPFKKPKKVKVAFDRKKAQKGGFKNALLSLFKKAKLSEENEKKIEALAKHLGIDKEEIEDNGWGFDADGGEYAVMTDDEADQQAKDYMEDSLAYFNTDFLLSNMSQDQVNAYLGVESSYYDEDTEEEVEIDDDEEAFYLSVGMSLEEYVQDLQSNDDSSTIYKLLDSFDDFVQEAISVDGRGHFLSSYDGEENEVDGFYIYRTN